jgi:CubicO group peptidase (beta-lactamase class C family)
MLIAHLLAERAPRPSFNRNPLLPSGEPLTNRSPVLVRIAFEGTLVLGSCLVGVLPLRSQTAASAVPVVLDDGWEREDPAAAGFDAPRLRAALAEMMNGKVNMHGLVIERHGRLVAELYRRGKDRAVLGLFSHTGDFGPSDKHDARSVGRSVIRLLVGIAQQQGTLGSVTTPVLDFYPECAGRATGERRAITLEHLLTMSSGLKWYEGGGEPDDEFHLMWTWSPTSYVLSRPIVAKAGTRFTYNGGGTLLLADIVGKVTGMAWKDYARTELFAPLGITDLEWKEDFHGRAMAYAGLRMWPRDMAKLGRLVLNRGQWHGKQVVPAAWIAESLRPRLATGFDDTRYGRFFWTGTVMWQGRSLPWAAAFGNGSQRIFVVPDLDMTVVMTAGAYGDIQTARRVNVFLAEIVGTVSN